MVGTLGSAGRRARPLRECLRENVHYTFGGFNFPTTFQSLLADVGIDRVMFSVDYPVGLMHEARIVEHLPVSALGTESESRSAMPSGS